MDKDRDEQKINQSTRKRLEFIDSRLYWEGKIGRNDLIEYFNISIPQATNDIKKYTDMFPDNITYDPGIRMHIVKKTFTSGIINPNSSQYLDQMLIHSMNKEMPFYYGTIPSFDNLHNLNRPVVTDHLKKIVRAINHKSSIEITYHSMDNGVLTRWVSPNALAYDGNRLHVRAYCYKRQSFRDFNLGRIESIGNQVFDSVIDNSLDYLWETSFDIILQSHPGLEGHQKECIEKEYQMENGQVIVPIRAAFLYYFYHRYDFDVENYQTVIEPKKQQIIISNKEELDLKAKLLEQMSKDKLQTANYTVPKPFQQEQS